MIQRQVLKIIIISFLIIPNIVFATHEDYAGTLDGTNSEYYDIANGDQTDLNLTSDFTLEISYYVTDLPSDNANEQTIMARFDSTSHNKGYIWRLMSDDTMRVYYDNTSGPTYFDSDSAILDSDDIDTWVYLSAVVDISVPDVTMYKATSSLPMEIPSTAIASGATSLQATPNTFYLGRSYFVLDEYLYGNVNNARVWDDMRTEEEIQTFYACNLDGTEDNLVAAWGFENDTLDRTSNNNDLDTNNGPGYTSYETENCYAVENPAEIPYDLPWVDNMSIITGTMLRYASTSSTTPEINRTFYIRIPLIVYGIFAFMFLYIGHRIYIELLIRWRKQ